MANCAAVRRMIHIDEAEKRSHAVSSWPTENLRVMGLSGMYHFFQGRFVADDQGSTLQLQQLLLLELGEQAADCLARGPDHLRDFFVREGQFNVRRISRFWRPCRPGEHQFGQFL
jgi:hypothetical protein